MENLEGIVSENYLNDKECNYFIEYHKENFDLKKPFCKLHRNTKIIQCMELLGNPIIKKLYQKLIKFAKNIDSKITVNYFEIVHWPVGS
jgi:hypothetical protein